MNTGRDAESVDAPTRVAEGAAEARLTGRVLVVVAALMWSVNGLFAKAPIFASWSDEERGLNLCFWRALFAGLWLLPFVRNPRVTWRYAPLLISFAVMNVSFLQSLSLTTAANAIWLQSIAPVWIFLLGALIWREPLERRDLTTLGWGLAGASIILGFELSHGVGTSASLVGVMFGIIAGVSYAVVVLSIRQLRGENPVWLIALSLLVTAAVVGPYVLGRWGLPSPTQLGILSMFGLVQMGVPYLLLAEALRRIASQEASGIGLIEPVLVPLWVFLVWGEAPAWWTLLGGALILVGLLLRYRRSAAM